MVTFFDTEMHSLVEISTCDVCFTFRILVVKVEGSEVKAQLLLALAWFHGIVQERRIFMPQGWTKEYDFSVGDLRWAFAS